MLVTAQINSLKYFNQPYQCHQYTRLSKNFAQYNRTPLIWINWHSKPSG